MVRLLIMKAKKFDCIEMKRLASQRIYDEVKDMTVQEELAYWQAIRNTALNLIEQETSQGSSPVDAS